MAQNLGQLPLFVRQAARVFQATVLKNIVTKSATELHERSSVAFDLPAPADAVSDFQQ